MPTPANAATADAQPMPGFTLITPQPARSAQELTASVQTALNSDAPRVSFAPGHYKLGSLVLPTGTRLKFADGAIVEPDASLLKDKRLLSITGNDVAIDGLHLRFPQIDGHELGIQELRSIIEARNVTDLRVTRLKALRTEKNYAEKKNGQLVVLRLDACNDIVVRDCDTSYLWALVQAQHSVRLAVRNNKAVQGQYITLFNNGSEWLLHEGNWSQHVTFQCQWWGGDSNDGHKQIPRGTASTVKRGSRPGDEGFLPDTAGTYDIQVLGNFAEYGMTLAWGSKGRNVIIANNLARYMRDMAYDTEGTGTAIIANNISINSRYFGIGCYFWGDSVLISGNLVMVEPEGDPVYQGDFLRLHSANTKSFGNRRILVTGNQFVAREGKPRVITIEASEDVTISGNKLVNGRINMVNASQEVLILNNDIKNTLPGNYHAVRGAEGVKRLIIKGNVFRREANEDAPLPAEAALALFFPRNGRAIVENNIIEGWKYAAWTGRLPSGNGSAIFRNNDISGELVRDQTSADAKLFRHGNLNLDTLQNADFRLATEVERQPRPQKTSAQPIDTVTPNAPPPMN
ncbi:hypothetical protein [Geminisphaera colitermitum]|uniref:hypothetical protein n=1 Tax=Geminisphaera colitermitum TaxID=1148786 RepID=UPI0012FF1F62|nr:hypothetical protein [Geminisphaera colitermitum]